MKYKEIKLFAKDSAQLAMLTEELTAAGFNELLINDPKDVDELQEGSWAYTGSIADKELLDSFSVRLPQHASPLEIEALSSSLASPLFEYQLFPMPPRNTWYILK